jgi:hypothetical protein
MLYTFPSTVTLPRISLSVFASSQEESGFPVFKVSLKNLTSSVSSSFLVFGTITSKLSLIKFFNTEISCPKKNCAVASLSENLSNNPLKVLLTLIILGLVFPS